jgi:hypothetical protein
MPPRVRKIVKGLIAEGMQTIQQTHTFHFVLRKDIHSIDRDVVVSAHVSEPMFYFREIIQVQLRAIELALQERYPTSVDISWLPQEKLTALSKWVNNAVKENRMREVTMSTVAWFLEHACVCPSITSPRRTSWRAGRRSRRWRPRNTTRRGSARCRRSSRAGTGRRMIQPGRNTARRCGSPTWC